MAIIVNRSNGPIGIPGRMGTIRLRAGRDPVEIPDDALDSRYLDAAVASGQISVVAAGPKPSEPSDRNALVTAAASLGIKVGKKWSMEKIEAAMREKMEG